jgi:hypothetical protein
MGMSARRLPTHVLLLVILSLSIFPFRSAEMFAGLDGEYMRIMIRDYSLWSHLNPVLGLNIFEGMGNTFFPQHMSLIAPYLLQQLLGSTETIPSLSYSIFAVELFLATWLWGRISNLPSAACLSGAWIITLMALPFLNRILLYPVYQLVPQIIDELFFAVLFVYCFKVVSWTEAPVFARYLSIIAIAVIPLYLVASNPLFVLIFGPVIGATTLFLAVTALTIRRRLICLALVAGVSLLLGAGGPLVFIYGETLDTAAAMFAKEMFHANLLANASIVFQHAAFPGGPYLVGSALLGSVLVLLCGESRQKSFAAFHIILTALLIGSGVLIVLVFPHSTAPDAIYYELVLWPAYGTYGSAGLVVILRMLGKWQPLHLDLSFTKTAERWLASAVAAVLLLPTLIAPRNAGASAYPPRSTAIVDRLKAQIALKPGDKFRGYVATFTGTTYRSGPIGWLEQHAFDQLSLVPALSNDHRFIGLWYFNIPTLNEYSQYTRPELYAIESRLMTRPHDLEVRNVSTLTSPNLALLQALGARYLLTDQKLSEVGPEDVVLTVPNTPYTLRLYELKDPNLATYSPTTVQSFASARALLEAMRDTNFRKTALTTERIAQPLVPAETSIMTASAAGILVHAKSTAVSLLVVPILYSHCLTAKFDGARPETFSLQRVNLAETGLLFSGDIDVTLQREDRPFGSNFCLLKDLADAKSIRLDDIPAIGALTNAPRVLNPR